ncbi:MAG: branched-chain amino acid ABC transporter permease [Rhodanobacteraceae bacterium]
MWVIRYPLVFSSVSDRRLGALVLLFAIAGSSWNILGGYTGYISFGHAIFFGCGAYSALLATQLYGLPSLVGLPAGVVISVVIAAVAGIPTLRLNGHYFSMATIALAELIRLLVSNSDFLGSTSGVSGPAVPRSVFDFSFTSMLPYYYVFLCVLTVVLLVTFWISRSRFGYYLRAIQGSERAARSLGVPAARYKFYALALSAALTSVAGSFFGCMVGFVSPDSAFGIILSVQFVVIAALGGVNRILGPFVGALILIPVGQISDNVLGASGNGLTFIVYGGIIVLISVFRPGGILPMLEQIPIRAARVAEFFK